MQFLNPTILWALGALAIPIIIHLFHFRRFKKVYFTNVNLLKEIKEETSTRNKLKSLLILLARCAALAMIVFAFAQPILKSGDVNNVQNHAIEIIVDNSFSMQARSAEIPLFTYARDRAKEIVEAYDDQDRFLILTHDLLPKHQRYVDQKTALGFLDELKITPNVEYLSDLTNIISRLRNSISDYQHNLYILSDFQENISAFPQTLDTSVDVSIIPFRAVQENNIAIIDAEWEAPVAMNNSLNQMIVTLENFSDEIKDAELRMEYEDQERPLGTIRIGPNATALDTISIPVNNTGWHHLVLTIDDYPIEFDNSLYISFNIKEQVDVLSLYDNSPNSYLISAFESISYYQLTQQASNSIRYESFQDQELIILDDLDNISSGLSSELIKFVGNGGNLLIFPSINANIDAYNDLLGPLNADRLVSVQETDKYDVGSINTEEFIFKDVFVNTKRNIRLPSTASNFVTTSNQSSGKEWLLRYRDGKSFLTKNTFEKGNVYLCAAPLSDNSSDLVRNAEIFVPMLYKMALSTGQRRPLYYTIGEDDVIALDQISENQSERFQIEGPLEFIPGITSTRNSTFMDVRGQISEAGFYSLVNEGKTMHEFSFNFDRTESNVLYKDLGILSSEISRDTRILNEVALANISEFISEKNEGTRLWRWCLILGLIFLLMETLLIRFWK